MGARVFWEVKRKHVHDLDGAKRSARKAGKAESAGPWQEDVIGKRPPRNTYTHRGPESFKGLGGSRSSKSGQGSPLERDVGKS